MVTNFHSIFTIHTMRKICLRSRDQAALSNSGIPAICMILFESRCICKTRENRISLPRWKKKKKIEVQLVCSFSNEISFIFIFILQQTTSIHSHSFNIIKSSKSSKSKSKPGWEKKERKWTSSTTVEQIENPIRLTRAWREYEQTTLPQLPAFPALCKCNEHPITSNAHWYPSGH